MIQEETDDRLFPTSILLMVVITLLVVFVLWIIIYYYYSLPNETTKNQPTFRLDPEDINYGTFTRLSLAKRLRNRRSNNPRRLIRDSSACNNGKIGNHCHIQPHISLYYNVGKFARSEYTKETIKVPVPLSFNSDTTTSHINSCTSICDRTEGCKGVEYDHTCSQCSLIMSDIKASAPAVLDFESDKQVYLKRNLRPHITNRVYGFSGRRPLRYYLSNRTEQKPILKVKRTTPGVKANLQVGTVSFIPGVIKEMDWIPYKLANYGELVGIWTNDKSILDEMIVDRTCIKDLASNETSIFIDRYYAEYFTPTFVLKWDKAYVLYLPKDACYVTLL